MHPLERGIQGSRSRIEGAHHIVFVTGAGMSKESGIPTFRGAEGLWRTYSPQELANPEAFNRDPTLVWGWYDMRRRKMAPCDPNPGHLAIARFQLAQGEAGAKGKGVHIVTQNVDGLHALALNRVQGRPDDTPIEPDLAPLELHGNIYRIRCTQCGRVRVDRGPINTSFRGSLPHCAHCGAIERPDIVWFGESLPEAVLNRAIDVSQMADLSLVVGTSALVQPAASLPLLTKRGGGDLIEVNPSATPLSREALICLRLGAGEAMPQLLE